MAERRYQAVDPENRLVAATLERRWEDTLCQERELKEEYDRYAQQTLSQLTAEDAARITALASDIPALWHSPKTTNADRQAIIRCLVERVVVNVERNTEHVEATIHWKGGYESRHEFTRPVRTYEQLQGSDLLLKRVIELRDAGKTAKQSAEILNAEASSRSTRAVGSISISFKISCSRWACTPNVSTIRFWGRVNGGSAIWRRK